MRRTIFSLLLAAALCAGLTPYARAEGTTMSPTPSDDRMTITITNVLRTETPRYRILHRDGSETVWAPVVYVVSDEGATLHAAAKTGQPYAAWSEDGELMAYAMTSYGIDRRWDAGLGCFVDEEWDTDWSGEMQGPETYEIQLSGEDGLSVSTYFGFTVVCESDFNELVPFTGRPKAAGWAQDTLDRAFDAGLFPYQIDPFMQDCTRSMTRAEFAAVMVELYEAAVGKDMWEMDIYGETPFTDLREMRVETIDGQTYEYEGYHTYAWQVGYAYALGFVTGTGATTFSPDKTLTRAEAATMLGRVCARLYGGIPEVTATGFADDGAIPGWAKDGAAFLAGRGVVQGVGGNSFAPNKTLTIQEAMVMAQRMLESYR